MNIWGKVVGGAAGMMLGGPLGAAFGAAMGHAYDRMASAAWQSVWAIMPGGAAFAQLHRVVQDQFKEQARQTVFAIALLALGSALARADGPVNAAEEATFRRLFGVPDDEADAVLLVLRRGLPIGDMEAHAARMADLFQDTPGVLEELLAALVLLAQADGPLNSAEEEFLTRLAVQLGLPPQAWRRARAGATRSAGVGGDPHAVLGVNAAASDAEVRAAFRKLLRENHPDVLMAQGMPAEFVEVANRRMAAINAAYDDIARMRGLK
ncbi:MAG: TerB family tellurite resistance protein [Rhodospirillaceae bacterium]